MNSNSRREGAGSGSGSGGVEASPPGPAAVGRARGSSMPLAPGSGGVAKSPHQQQRRRSRSPLPHAYTAEASGPGGSERAQTPGVKRARLDASQSGSGSGGGTGLLGGSRSAGASASASPARPSLYTYSPTSILASMNGHAASVPLPPPVNVTLPYRSALSPGTAIHSPRRAMVCSSLEHAAMASSLLTQSAIHPAILHSLSVRLQAMNDTEADIVLARLGQIASHLQHTQNQQAHRKQQQLQFLQAMSAAGAAQAQSQPVSSTSATQRQQQQQQQSPSPMPNLSSSSSVNSTNNSNTTSPTVSPAVSAQTATAPPSPQNQLAQKPPPTPPQTSLAAHARDPASHPPLHPQPALTPYAQMLLSNNGARMQQQQQQQQQQQAQSPHQPSHPSAQPKEGGVPHTLRTSFVGATTSTSSASTTSPSGDDLPQLDSSLAPPLVRSHSEDSDIPMGLMMLIEALPGSTSAVVGGGSNVNGNGNGTPLGLQSDQQLKGTSPRTPRQPLAASPAEALAMRRDQQLHQAHAPDDPPPEILPPLVSRQRSTSL